MQKEEIDKLQKKDAANKGTIKQLQDNLKTAKKQNPFAISPQQQGNVTSIANADVDKKLLEAKALLSSGNVMEADAIVNSLKNPANALSEVQSNTLATIRKKLFDNKVQMGKKYFDSKEYQKGIDILNSALSDNINTITKDKALYNLGKCYVKNGQKDLAKQTFDKLKSEYPNSNYIKYISGWLSI